MTLEFRSLGRVRKVLEGIDAEPVGNGDNQIGLSGQLEQLVAASSAPYEEIVRMGRSFWTGTTTAVAAVVAIPTTAHMFSLYNNAADGGRCMVIDWVAASGVAKTAAAGQGQLLCNVGQVRETAPSDAGQTIKKLNGYGSGAADSVARSLLTGTALPATTGLAANWMPMGPAIGFPGAAATPGHGLWAAVDGRIVVPPGRYFATHVLADVVGSTFQMMIGWHEVQLVLA